MYVTTIQANVLYRHLPTAIPLHPDPNPIYVAEITRLNRALHAWGYTDDLRAFSKQLDGEVTAITSGREDLLPWLNQREVWLEEGDRILDDMQVVITGGCMDLFDAKTAGRVWGELTSVAFKVMYLMSAVEVRFDILL